MYMNILTLICVNSSWSSNLGNQAKTSFSRNRANTSDKAILILYCVVNITPFKHYWNLNSKPEAFIPRIYATRMVHCLQIQAIKQKYPSRETDHIHQITLY